MARWRWWSSATFRWRELNFSPPSSIFRWPTLLSSYFTPSWAHSLDLSGLSPLAWRPNLNFSIVDDVVWSLITAVESVALVSMFCFFFVFCGCTV
ncbi:hypothetical protein ACSBR2_003903 [Camellia fascicularis]|uniref:Uncharacterized protein n=1 Tax=Camellia sinensis TaxID=4442 RepID=A0A7J7H1L0_CAMSI|nr:hypothetical protein HYC85_017107 [Camellia sinensis]